MKKNIIKAAVLAAVLTAGAAPALAQGGPFGPISNQPPDAIIDCIAGEPCTGTPGVDVIYSSGGQDVISGLEGDDRVFMEPDPVQDFVFCGPGLDSVDFNVFPSGPGGPGPQGFFQYQPDFVAEDCEAVLPPGP